MSLDVSVYISLVQISLSGVDYGDELESTDDHDSYRDMETGSETEVSLIIVVL